MRLGLIYFTNLFWLFHSLALSAARGEDERHGLAGLARQIGGAQEVFEVLPSFFLSFIF